MVRILHLVIEITAIQQCHYHPSSLAQVKLVKKRVLSQVGLIPPSSLRVLSVQGREVIITLKYRKKIWLHPLAFTRINEERQRCTFRTGVDIGRKSIWTFYTDPFDWTRHAGRYEQDASRARSLYEFFVGANPAPVSASKGSVYRRMYRWRGAADVGAGEARLAISSTFISWLYIARSR